MESIVMDSTYEGWQPPAPDILQLAEDVECDSSTGTGRRSTLTNTTYGDASSHLREPSSMEIGGGPPPPDDIIIHAASATDAESESRTERWKRRKIVALYLLTVTILFADLNLLAPNLSIIADEFDMADDERDVKLGGLMSLGFFLVGAPVAFLVGWLADSFNRSSLMAATTFFGEIGCLAVVFVRNYWQLYMCRYVTIFP